MKDAAARTDFEIAADIRDQIRALEVTLEEQQVVSADFVDQDVVGFHRDGVALEIVVMSIRAGKLSGNRAFSFTGQEFPDAELISSFLGLYYDMGASVPDEVLLPIEIEDAALKAEWLTERRAAAGGRKKKVELLVPQRGRRRKLVELARKNAAASFATRRNARADTELALGKLQKRLKLPRLPRTIECYDVSHLQGFATVASMVVFVDGRPEKARYRTYKVRAPAAGGRSHADERRLRVDVRGAVAAVPARARGRRRRRRVEAARSDRRGRRQGTAGDGAGGGARRRHRRASRRRPADRGAREGARGWSRRTVETGGTAATGGRETEGAMRGAAAPAPPQPRGPRARPPTRRARRTKSKSRRKARSRLSSAREGRDPNPPEQRRDVRVAGAARRGASLRGQLPPRPAPPADAAVGAVGYPRHRSGRQRQLLRHFGSIKRVREASVDDLAAVPGISRSIAEAVFAHWAKQPVEAAAPSRRYAVTAENEAGKQAEELAIDDAFAASRPTRSR